MAKCDHSRSRLISLWLEKAPDLPRDSDECVEDSGMIARPIKVVMGSRVPPGLKPMIEAVRRRDDRDGTERSQTPRLG